MGTVGQPSQLASQIPGNPPVQRRPVDPQLSGYFDNLSAIQNCADRIQALLNN